MIPPPDNSDVSFFEWLVGGFGALGLFVLGMDAKQRKYIDGKVDKMAGEHGVENAALWAAFNAEQARATQFREKILVEMVTKQDLNGVKQELMDAIYRQRPTPQPPREPRD